VAAAGLRVRARIDIVLFVACGRIRAYAVLGVDMAIRNQAKALQNAGNRVVK
jgi:hypothetical protein